MNMCSEKREESWVIDNNELLIKGFTEHRSTSRELRGQFQDPVEQTSRELPGQFRALIDQLSLEREICAWRDAREKLARLLREDPSFAAYWSHPVDEGKVVDDLVEEVRSGELSRRAYAARYGATDQDRDE